MKNGESKMTLKWASGLFLVIIILLIIVDFLLPIHFLFYVLAGVIYISFVGIKSSQISSGFHLHAICNAPTSEKIIAITFDDGPDNTITPEVLNILAAHKAKAAFFCIGKNIQGNEALLIRMKKEGHIIGNHTFSHAFLFDFYPSQMVKKELDKTNETIRTIIDKTPRFFRPPYGVTNPAINKAIKRSHFEVVGWSVRSLDTVLKNEVQIIKRVTENLKGGDIVLFHDTNKRIVEVLEFFLQYINKNGFKVVGLDELIKKSPYA